MHSKSVHLDGGGGVKTNNTTVEKKTGGGRKKPLALKKKESIKNKKRVRNVGGVFKNIICSKNKRGRKAKKRVQENKSTSLVVPEDPDCDRFLHDHNKCIRSVFWLDEGNLSDLYEQIECYRLPSP